MKTEQILKIYLAAKKKARVTYPPSRKVHNVHLYG